MTIEEWGGSFAFVHPSQPGTAWPVGEDWWPNEQLKRILASAGRYHARQAVAMFVSDDFHKLLEAAVSVGCAVELIAKAFVASIEHTLLAEKGEHDALLILAGKGHLAKIGPTDLKSVTAQEALLRAKRHHPALVFNPQISNDQIVLKVRNAAAHMALVDRAELRRAVLVMCRVIDDLLVPLGLDRGSFWGGYALPVVDELLNQAKIEVRQVVAAKMAAARKRLDDLIGGLDLDSKVSIVASLSRRRARNVSDHSEVQLCPTCGAQGWLICSVERGQVEYDADEDGYVGAWVSRVAYPYAFECTACELELDELELPEFAFPTEIALEPDGEPYEAYGEPDEDLGRDR